MNAPGEMVEHLFRRQAGRMTAALVRIFGPQNLQLAEDVVDGGVADGHGVFENVQGTSHGMGDSSDRARQVPTRKMRPRGPRGT